MFQILPCRTCDPFHDDQVALFTFATVALSRSFKLMCRLETAKTLASAAGLTLRLTATLRKGALNERADAERAAEANLDMVRRWFEDV